MNGLGLWYVLSCVGLAVSSPYYYRESKHHAEHHREYSYDGQVTPPEPVQHSFLGEGVEVPDMVSSAKPEKYSGYPSQLGGYGTERGAYSYSPGITQHSHIPVSLANQRTIYSSYHQPMVIRRTVRVYSYPGSTIDSGLFHASDSKSNSDLLGSEHFGSTLGSESVSGLSGGSLYTSRLTNEGILEGQKQADLDEISQRETSDDFGQMEVSREVGQRERSGEIGQKEIRLTASSRRETQHYQSGDIQLGQQQETDYNQREQPLLTTNYGKVGQTINSFSNIDHQKQNKESLYPTNPIFPQKNLDLEIGQKEESLYQRPQHVYFGKQEKVENHKIESVHRTEESLYNKHETGDLDLGQREESLIGQEAEELGKTAKSDSHYQSGFLTGQQPVDIGQQPEQETSLFHQSKFNKLDVGQSVGQNPSEHESGGLELGQNEESLGQESEDIGQMEESDVYSPRVTPTKVTVQQSEHGGSLYQQSKFTNLNGEQSSVVPSQRQPFLTTYHRHESDLELGQREESLEGQESENLGQIEESDNSRLRGTLTKVTGQQLEQESSLYNQSKVSNVDLGQSIIPAQSQHLVPTYQHEAGNVELVRPKEVFGGQESEDLGQIEDTHNYPPRDALIKDVGPPDMSGQVPEEGGRLYQQSKYSHLSVVSPVVYRPNNFQQKENSDTLELSQQGYSSVKPHGGLLGSISGYQNTRTETGQKERLEAHRYSQSYEHKAPQYSVSTDSPQGNGKTYNWQISRSCEHGQRYQHDGFGAGLVGHNAQILNNQQSKDTNKFNIIYSSSARSPTNDFQDSTTKTSASKLNKMVEDLALELELEDGVKKPSSNQAENIQLPQENAQQKSSTFSSVHKAEVHELGLENFDTPSSSQISTASGSPERQVRVFETHREEYGLDYPSAKKTYSKKHTRHYSVNDESHSNIGQPEDVEKQLSQLLSLTRSGQESLGGWQTYSRNSHSADQDVKQLHEQHIQRRDASAQSDRHATIDEFLTELDKDIGKTSGSRRESQGGGYVQVSSQQRPESSSGTSYYSEKTVTNHSGSSSSGGSGNKSWYQKLGDNIGSSYNKAKENISSTFSQAKVKAKEIVRNVKDQVGMN